MDSKASHQYNKRRANLPQKTLVPVVTGDPLGLSFYFSIGPVQELTDF